MNDMKLWDKVALLLTSKKLTQDWLATTVGVRKEKISRWKGGEGEPNRLELLRMAKALEVTTDFLADDTLDEPPAPPRLADDERAVLDIYRAMRPTLDQTKAIRALAAAALGNPGIVMQGEPAELPGPPPGIDPSYRAPLAPLEPLDGVVTRKPRNADEDAEKRPEVRPGTHRKKQM